MANIILFTDRGPFNDRGITVKTDDGYIGLDYYNRASGAYVLASFLRKKGYSVVVVPDASKLSFNGIKDFIDRNSNNLLWVGISTTFYYTRSNGMDRMNAYRKQWAETKDMMCSKEDLYLPGTSADTTMQLLLGHDEINLIADYLHDIYRDVPLLIGGAWVTHIKNGNLYNLRNNVYIVTGNAETYVDTISHDLKEKKSERLILAISNDSYNDHEFKQSSICYSDRDHVQPDEWMPIEISRACAFNCAYCTYDRKSTSDNYKDSEVLRNELIENYERFGVTRYVLLDDLYNDSKIKVRKLYDEVWSKLPFRAEWISYIRLDMIWADPESANYIMESGCRLANFGIETLHDKAGKKVGKGLGKKRILETLAHCKDVWQDEVFRAGLFITGLPHEPVEHMLDTIQWLKTTDLLHSYSMNPLWITPPDHKKFVSKQNTMSDQNEKFGIRWDSQGWVHDHMNFSVAVQLAKNSMEFFPNSTIANIIGQSEYAELRSMGFSHLEIVNRKSNLNFVPEVRQKLITLNQKIDQRINSIFNYSDCLL